MTPFLKSVAKYLSDTYGSNLHEIAIVFPNKRARLFFNNYLSEILDKPSFSPAYFTISELFEKLSTLNQADDLTLLFTLYQSYCKKINNPQPFDYFYPYCKTLLADLDDLEKYHVTAKSLFSNLSDIRSMEMYADYLTNNQKEALLKFWQIFDADNSYAEKTNFLQFWDSLYAIYSDFTETLRDKELAFEGMIYKEVSSNFSDYIDKLTYTKYAFVGFNALNLSEKKVFSSLQNHQKALFFWDYDSYYVTPPTAGYHQAGYFLKDYIKTFPAPEGFSFESDLTGKKSIKIINVPTNTGQVSFVPKFINYFRHINYDDCNDLLIGLGDENLLQPLIYNLPDTIKEINITMGYPGKRTNTYQLFLNLTNLYLNSKNTDNQYQLYYKDVIAILNSPILKANQANFSTSDLVLQITKQNYKYISPDFLQENSEGIFIQAFLLGKNNLEVATHIFSIFEILIENQNYIKDDIHIIERETLLHLHKRLNDFSIVMNDNDVPMSNISFLKLMRNFISDIQIPFSGEPLHGAQVMGVLETRNLDFKNILLLSMNEGIFPKPSMIPSMIPYTLRKGFDMPTPEHQDAIFSYYFYRLLHRAENVVFVYSSKDDGLNKGEPSRFLSQLVYDTNFQPEEITLSYNVQPLLNRSVKGIYNENISAFFKSYLGDTNRFLSPSAFNTWLSCRLLFYFRYVAGLKEKEEISSDIEANVFGSILHYAIKELYEDDNKTFDKERIGQIYTDDLLVEKAVENAFIKEYFQHIDISKISFEGNILIVKEVIKKYIKSILKYDSQIAPFIITELEKSLYAPYTIKSLQQEIKLGGTIDRLDNIDNTTRVVDYKTGKKKLDFTTIESLFNEIPSKRNGAALQLLLYSYIVSQRNKNKKIIPALYFTKELNNPDYSFLLQMGQPRKKVKIECYQDISAEFEEMLEVYLENFFSQQEDFSQTTDLKFCERCTYRQVCNRG